MQPVSSNNIKIELIDKQINQQQNIIDRSQNTLDRLDASISDKYIDMEYVTRGLKKEKNKKKNEIYLNLAINNAIDEIAKLTLQKVTTIRTR